MKERDTEPMAGETTITVIGNLTADPELRYTQSGVAVANVTVASTPRHFDRQTNEWKDGETLFLRGSIWRAYAENVAASLKKGQQVIVQGRLGQRKYEKDGQTHTAYELEIDEIGPALRHGTATFQKVARDSNAPAAPVAAAPAPAAPQGAAPVSAPAQPVPAAVQF